MPLSLTALDLRLAFEDSANISRFPENTLRGALGYALRSAACTASATTACPDCNLRGECLYAVLFEPAPLARDGGLYGKNEGVPKPLIIQAGTVRGHILPLRMILVGRAGTRVQALLEVMNTVGKKGLGKSFDRFSIIEHDVETAELNDVLPGEAEQSRAVISLESPLTLRRDGHFLDTFLPGFFVRRLLQRYTALCDMWGDGYMISAPAVEQLLAAADSLSIIDGETWVAQQDRMSTRQHERIRCDGILGSLLIEGDIGTLAPLLFAGMELGVGKNTVWGFGRYTVSAA